MILPWAFLGCIVPHSSLKHYRHLDGPAFYSEEKVRLPDNRSEGNTSNPSGGQVRWEERRRWILLMLWQLCQYKFISMYRTILVFKKQNSTSVVFMNSSLSRPPQEEQMNLVQTVCEMQNFWKSKMLSTDSFLDLISISSGLLFMAVSGIWPNWFSGATTSVLNEQKDGTGTRSLVLHSKSFYSQKKTPNMELRTYCYEWMNILTVSFFKILDSFGKKKQKQNPTPLLIMHLYIHICNAYLLYRKCFSTQKGLRV